MAIRNPLVLVAGVPSEIPSGDTIPLANSAIWYPNNLQFVNTGTGTSDLFSIATAGTTGGTATAYTLTPSTALTGYITNMVIWVKFNATNTGGSTLNISALGAKTIVKDAATAVIAGDIIASKIYELIYDGTNFQIRDIFPATALDQTGSKVYGTTTNSTNTYSVTLTPALTAYTAGNAFLLNFNAANTGAATINVNGLGAKSLVKNASTALISGDITSGKVYQVLYDGTNFQMRDVSDALKANLASPTFTGTVTIPTPAFSTTALVAVDQAYLPLATSALLSTTTGINAKTVAATTLYTVPSGKTLIVTGVFVVPTTATAATVGPNADVQTSATGDIYANVNNLPFATGKVFQYTPGGVSNTIAAAGTVKLNISTGATGTTLTYTVLLMGILF